MSELDEQAVEAAAKALYTTWLDAPGAACMEPWSDDEDDETDWQSVARNDAITSITAYLAARPTPDAEAWVPMSDDDVAAMTARIKSGEADADEQARFAMTNMMFIIHQWASGAVDATSQQAYAAALLHHAKRVNNLFRKAAAR